MSYAKVWVFTLNNYTEADEKRLAEEHPDLCYLLYGREVGDSGTPHLQGFAKFHRRLRMASVKAIIGEHAHVEVCRNTIAAIQYCKKDGDIVEKGAFKGAGGRSDLDEFKDAVQAGMLELKEIREHHSDVYAKYPRFCLEYLQDHYPRKVLPVHELSEWQQSLKLVLDGPADDRTIIFAVDTVGNKGKTWFAHWYCQNHDNVQVLSPGKKADMAYCLCQGTKVLFLDAPRSKQGEFVQYDFLEDVKNGYVFSPKYESRLKELPNCHVVVLMNECPDMTKLSEDRYHIINLD